MLVAAESDHFQVHGRHGSYIKDGLDPQEDNLKAGARPPAENWGHDARDGVLTQVDGDQLTQRPYPTLPGNYPAYYAGVRDAILGNGENPVTAAEAIRVMELIELGQESASKCQTLPLI